MFGRAKKTGRDSRGANLVEFAVVTMLLFLLVAGIWDLGRVFHTYIVMANAAREGARLGSRLPCNGFPFPWMGNWQLATEIRGAVTQEAATNGVSLAGCFIGIAPDPTFSCDPWRRLPWTPPAGTPLTVTVTCPYQTDMAGITGINSFWLSWLTARSSMAIFGNDAQ
jgi:hypothetical protein